MNLLFLSGNLLAVIALLIYIYQQTGSPGVRGKIRIVVLGGVIGLLPVITLITIPGRFLGAPIIPYTSAFLFLGITPITYSYAIIRHRLIKIDEHVNRGATYILVFSVLAGFYLLVYSLIQWIQPISLYTEPIINTVLVLLLASVFTPFRQWMQKQVDKAFYGGWYDYRSAVTGITQGLEQVTDLSNLASTICDRLAKTLQLENVCAFLRDLGGEFSVIQIAPQGNISSLESPGFSTLPKNSLAYLLNVGAVERTSLRRSLSEISLSPEERQLLDSEQANLWLPVIGHGQVLGLLALGPKLGGDVFSGEDMDILRIVARQLGPLIENIHLVTQLRQYAAELEQRVEDRTAELHAAKERVEAVLSSVGDGVIVTDLKGTIITVNQAFEEQSGFPAEEVLGREIYRLLNGQEGEDQSKEIRAALANRGSWNGELLAMHKGGRRYDVQLTIASIRDQSGEIIGYVGSQRDITQAKQLERLKDRFILEVSHELRTPVTNMGLFLDLLERGRPEKRADYLSTLKNEVNQLAHMIEDILDLSRLEISKQKKAAFRSVDLNLLAEQVISAHVPLAQEGGLELEFEPAKDLPPVRGEPNQLSHLITNLLSNAIRYTPAGCVWVRTFISEDGVCLEVKDTGIGIDPEDYPHLFERFYRGIKVSQSRIMGSGLGLALVKEIVDIHEGRIEWQSENGRGSTFQIWLPRI
ncbi:MAG TPA: ATP-binding protein [Anaerolineales bacterium]|nr:ATP-binding protein [Anaerolineales bacterium]